VMFMNIIYLVIMFFLKFSSSQLFVPVEFSAINPFLYDTNIRDINMLLNLCDSSLYDGCHATAFLNLPFTPWSISDGTYINYYITDDLSGCGDILCSNNASDIDPFTCQFDITNKIGDKLYLISSAGHAAGFQATFNMRLDCQNRITGKTNNTYGKTNLGNCPTTYDKSQRLYRINKPGSVKTSSFTSDANKYLILVCPDYTNLVTLQYTSNALDKYSATASYMCSNPNCNVGNSPPGWYDDSGVSINKIDISNLKLQHVWLTLYGWGVYKGMNNYTFHIELHDQ